MKKALLITTALVASTGMASAQNVTSSNADITLGGYARWGVIYSDPDTPGADSSTDITSRWRLQIDATTETDAGVTLGARVRFQVDGSDGDNALTQAEELNAARFFARMGGLEIGVGNIQGAIEFMPGQYTIDLGLTGLGYDYTVYDGNADAYSSGGTGASTRNGVEVIYGIGDFEVHVSASESATNDRIAAVVSYEFGNFTVAAGVQDSDLATDTDWTVAVEGSVGIFDFGVAYADNGDEAAGGGDHWSVMGRFDVGAATNVEFYVADADYFADTSYGVDFNHDLGGGATMRGGIASLRDGELRADFGVRFNF